MFTKNVERELQQEKKQQQVLLQELIQAGVVDLPRPQKDAADTRHPLTVYFAVSGACDATIERALLMAFRESKTDVVVASTHF